MGKLVHEISMSLDGYVAGPNATLEDPLGEHGEELHEWVFGLDAWKQAHGRGEGERGPDNDVVEEGLATTGAVIMGRKMWSGGSGPWEDDPNAGGWWGDDPPFGVPVFVLTHHERPPETKGDTRIEWVTDGIEPALAKAREAAGDRNVLIAGGASVAQQYLAAGLVDEVQIHLTRVLLGSGVRLFENLGSPPPRFELERTIASPSVTHLRYRVRNG
jgi:dihydrofolate reductase